MLIASLWNHSSDSRNLSPSLPRREVWVYRKIWIPEDCTPASHIRSPFRGSFLQFSGQGPALYSGISTGHPEGLTHKTQNGWGSLGFRRSPEGVTGDF